MSCPSPIPVIEMEDMSSHHFRYDDKDAENAKSS